MGIAELILTPVGGLQLSNVFERSETVERLLLFESEGIVERKSSGPRKQKADAHGEKGHVEFIAMAFVGSE